MVGWSVEKGRQRKLGVRTSLSIGSDSSRSVLHRRHRCGLEELVVEGDMDQTGPAVGTKVRVSLRNWNILSAEKGVSSGELGGAIALVAEIPCEKIRVSPRVMPARRKTRR